MKSSEWFENEDFWLNYAPIMFDAQHWAQANGIAQSIKKIAELNDGASVLDVCCGPGRISVELALLNLEVTGVDITQPFLDAAKESANDEKVSLNLINADMRTFRSKTKFDCAINVYNSFGYCNSIEEDFQILKSVYNSLKKGGKFILECISRETAIKFFTEGEWFERAGKTVLTDFSVEGAWEGLKSKWILISKDGSRMEHTFVQRLYSAADLRDELLKIGFKSAQVFGGWDLRPYNQTADTMLILAEK